MKRGRVIIQAFPAQIYLQVSQQVTDDEAEQYDARQRHYHLFANRRLIEAKRTIIQSKCAHS